MRSSEGSCNSRIEKQALAKEEDPASHERLDRLNRELAGLQEQSRARSRRTGSTRKS